MRALAVILVLSACRLHAHDTRGLDTIRNVVDCAAAIGPVKCLNALTAWRTERAIEHPNSKPNLTQDLELFPWTKYRNNTEDELYSEVCRGTEQLLRRKPLTLPLISGYRLELLSKGNGTLSFDVYKNAETRTSRSSMKKAKKTFYKIMPLLVLPGLIMSAILPFVLPALKLMVVGVGMLNNMALSGAVFTLLRNNAFNDKYEHKVIYVNEGYKNEKHANIRDHDFHEIDNHDYQIVESNYNGAGIPEIDAADLPLHSDWINQYYGNDQNVRIVENSHNPIKRGDRSRAQMITENR